MEKVRVSSREAEENKAVGGDVLTTLREQHMALEKRLAELARHVSLTSDEQIERVRLKKEKLVLKDRMARLGHA